MSQVWQLLMPFAASTMSFMQCICHVRCYCAMLYINLFCSWLEVRHSVEEAFRWPVWGRAASRATRIHVHYLPKCLQDSVLHESGCKSVQKALQAFAMSQFMMQFTFQCKFRNGTKRINLPGSRMTFLFVESPFAHKRLLFFFAFGKLPFLPTNAILRWKQNATANKAPGKEEHSVLTQFINFPFMSSPVSVLE